MLQACLRATTDTVYFVWLHCARGKADIIRMYSQLVYGSGGGTHLRSALMSATSCACLCGGHVWFLTAVNTKDG